MSSLHKFLTDHKVESIAPPKNGIIEIDSKSSLISGFEVSCVLYFVFSLFRYISDFSISTQDTNISLASYE